VRRANGTQPRRCPACHEGAMPWNGDRLPEQGVRRYERLAREAPNGSRTSPQNNRMEYGFDRASRWRSRAPAAVPPTNPTRMGASGNFGAGEQWAGRVCSVICQVYTTISVPVETVPISDATVVVPRVLCLDGPCVGLHRDRLAQSAPVDVLASALVVSKALHLSPKILATPTRILNLTGSETVL